MARSNLENAKVALQDAKAALEIVKAGPSALQAPLTALGPEMARLEVNPPEHGKHTPDSRRQMAL